MVDQMNRRILVQSGFIGSFDLPWSEWSRITDPDPNHPKAPHPWIPKTVLYSGFHAVDSEFQALDSGFWILCQWKGFRSPIIRGIPHSLICIPDSKTQDFGFHKKNFPEFGIRIPLQGANQRFLWLLMIIRDFKIQWRGRQQERQKHQSVLFRRSETYLAMTFLIGKNVNSREELNPWKPVDFPGFEGYGHWNKNNES